MSVPQLLAAGAGASAPTVPIGSDRPATLSRRDLLGLALAGVGTAAVGAVAAGTVALPAGQVAAQPAAAPAAPIPVPVGRTTLTLSAPTVRIEAIGQQPGRLPPLDRPFAARGEFADANGAILGTFAITPLPAAAGALQLHTFELEGGTLLGMGAATAGEGTFAIVGGTGRYRGAAGSYTARVGADASGRLVSAQFTFDLIGGE